MRTFTVDNLLMDVLRSQAANELELAFLLQSFVVRPEPAGRKEQIPCQTIDESVREHSRRIIAAAIASTPSRAAAARLLKIEPHALYYRMVRLGMIARKVKVAAA